MDCERLSKIDVAIQAITNKTGRRDREQVFNCIYTLFHAKFIQHIVSRYAINPDDSEQVISMAKDAFQEGLIKLIERADTTGLKPDAELQTIVFAFAKLQFLALKKTSDNRNKRHLSLDTFENSGKQFENRLFAAEVFEIDRSLWDESLHLFLSKKESDLYNAIRSLKSPEEQKIVLMKYIDKMSNAEIAGRMDISYDNVSTILHRTRKSLKMIMTGTSNL